MKTDKDWLLCFAKRTIRPTSPQKTRNLDSDGSLNLDISVCVQPAPICDTPGSIADSFGTTLIVNHTEVASN